MLCETASALKTLTRSKNTSSKFDQLRYVFFGGEELNSTIPKKWCEKAHNCQTIFMNMYGPAETTVTATGWTCDIDLSKNSIIPIGRPLYNKKVYLLDSQYEPVLLGSKGEMYIGGGSVACGYLNRPELSAERFLSDPFTGISEDRMYRTGDFARYLHDGNLIFLGRADQQIKLRGFRIEVAEIETHLIKHPQVHEAVVQPHRDGSDVRLIAYVVVDADTNALLLAQNLRSYLSNLLPDYMIPVAYIRLAALPLTRKRICDIQTIGCEENFGGKRKEISATKIGVFFGSMCNHPASILIDCSH